MKESKILSYNFENAKNQLKTFSEEIPTDVNLKKIEEKGGLFNKFDNKVTGEEINKLIVEIQDYLVSMNTRNINTIKEFGKVYEVFEVLDKEYIDGLIISIKAAEEASNQAKLVAEKAEKNSEDIGKTIETQKKTIEVLASFKTQLESSRCIETIDEISNNIRKMEEELEKVKKILETDYNEEKTRTCIKELIELERNAFKEEKKIFLSQIKVAYAIAGTSLVVTIFSIVLNLVGVL